MTIDDKVKSSIEDSKIFEKVKTGSFEECYGFVMRREYEPFSSNSESMTFNCSDNERSWAKITHIAPENAHLMIGRWDLIYQKWEVTLYDHHPED